MGSLKVDDVPVIMSIRREVNRVEKKTVEKEKKPPKISSNAERLKIREHVKTCKLNRSKPYIFEESKANRHPRSSKTIIPIKNNLYGNI